MLIGSTVPSVVLFVALSALLHAPPAASSPPAANHGLALERASAATSTDQSRVPDSPNKKHVEVEPDAESALVDRPALDPAQSEPLADERARQTSVDGEAIVAPGRTADAARPLRPLGQGAAGAFSGAEAEDGDAAHRPERFLSWLPAGAADFAQVGGALTLVVSLLFLTRRLLARSSRLLSGGARPSGVLEVLGRYPLGRGHSLVLLKLARRVLLVHQSGTTMSAITEVTDPQEVAGLLTRVEAGSSGRDALKFRSLLRQFQHEHDRPSRSAHRTGINLEPDDVSLDGDVDVVDLTRSQRGRGFAGWFGRKGRS